MLPRLDKLSLRGPFAYPRSAVRASSFHHNSGPKLALQAGERPRQSMRAAAQATQERAPTGRIRLFRLTHVIVVLTNVLQLLFMITFLVLLLLQLNEDIAVSWLAVFTPLWMSDAITTITGIQEMRRLCAPGESRRCPPPPAWQLKLPPPARAARVCRATRPGGGVG